MKEIKPDKILTPDEFRRDRFVNEVTNKLKLGQHVGDIHEDMGIIAVNTGDKVYQLDTDKNNPNSINNVQIKEKKVKIIRKGNYAEEVELPEGDYKVTDPIDDSLQENYDDMLHDKINEGFDYNGPEFDEDGNIAVEEKPDKEDDSSDEKQMIREGFEKAKEVSNKPKIAPDAVYRQDFYDNGFEIDHGRTTQKLTPHDDAEKVIYNGRTDELYSDLRLVEASIADIFNELTRRFDNIVVLLKRPLIRADDVSIKKHASNNKLNRKLHKVTGARNDRVINFKVDNRSFCMGDSHALYGMLTDMKIKTEEAMMSQMDHFYYDGNVGSASKSSKLAITKKKAGFKRRKKDEQGE